MKIYKKSFFIVTFGIFILVITKQLRWENIDITVIAIERIDTHTTRVEITKREKIELLTKYYKNLPRRLVQQIEPSLIREQIFAPGGLFQQLEAPPIREQVSSRKGALTIEDKNNIIFTKIGASPEELEKFKEIKVIKQKEAASVKLWFDHSGAESERYLEETGINKILEDYLRNNKQMYKANLVVIGSEITGKVVKVACYTQDIKYRTTSTKVIQDFLKRNPRTTQRWRHKLYSKGVTIHLKGYGIASNKTFKKFKNFQKTVEL